MSLVILRGVLVAVEALLISALLPLLSWTAGSFFRRNAAMRHLFWLAAFGVLIALPLLALLVPPRVLALSAGTPVAADVAMAVPVVATQAQGWSAENLVAPAAMALCSLWLLGVGWNLLPLALGAHGLMRMRRASTAFDRIGPCDVRLGGGPLTFGWIKPVILLPHDAPDWPRGRLDAVLRHEMAHVARRDSVTQWLSALGCAFYWPNPLVWLGARSLRRDAEMAADDRVLASGVQPSVYAAELVRLAADVRGQRFAVAMASPSSLEERVTSVLSPTPSRKGVTSMDALKIVLLGSACAVAIAFARPDIALAQIPSHMSALPAPAAPALMAMAAAPATPVAPAMPARKHKVHGSADTDNDSDRGEDEAAMAADQDSMAGESHDHHADGMSPQAREQLRQTMVQVKAELASQHAMIENAVSTAHANEATARAWRDAANEIHQAVRQAMDEIRPYMREAAKDPADGEQIGQKVDDAMARVQPRIDAAIARASAVRVHAEAVPVPPAPPAPPAPPEQ